MSDEVKKAIAEIKPALVATADKDGLPNVSPKGSFRVVDDQSVVFAELRSPRTIANLKENSKVSVIGLDPATRKGWRIWGKAEILTGGELFDSLNAEYKDKVNSVVKISVDEAITM